MLSIPGKRPSLIPRRLAGISMVRNELEVIESFVRHNLWHLDFMLVLDHGSGDGTRERLLALAGEGLPLMVLDYARPGFAKGQALTGLMRRAATVLGADWIVPLDADELLKPARGSSLRDRLALAHEARPLLLPWQTYVPDPRDDHTCADPFRRLVRRRARERKQKYKVAIPRTLAARQDILLTQGQHHVAHTGRQRPPKNQYIPGLHLAHYPVRSTQQIVTKVRQGWQAYLNEPNRNPDHGHRWRLWFERFEHGGEPGQEDLQALALSYGGNTDLLHLVRDPIELKRRNGDTRRARDLFPRSLPEQQRLMLQLPEARELRPEPIDD